MIPFKDEKKKSDTRLGEKMQLLACGAALLDAYLKSSLKSLTETARSDTELGTAAKNWTVILEKNISSISNRIRKHGLENVFE